MFGSKNSVDKIIKKFQSTVDELAKLASNCDQEAQVKEARRDDLQRGIESDRQEQRRAELLIGRFNDLLDTSEPEEEKSE